MNTKVLRQKAATVLEHHGWTQNTYGSVYEGFCIYGALIEAGCFDTDDYATDENPELELAAQEIHFELGLPLLSRKGNSLVAWNDSPQRTKEEVISALRGETKVAELVTDRELVTV